MLTMKAFVLIVELYMVINMYMKMYLGIIICISQICCIIKNLFIDEKNIYIKVFSY